VYCPLVLLVKVGWKQGKTFGSEEGKVMRNDSSQYGAEGKSWARGLGLVLCLEGSSMTKRCSFVFGGQKYDETVQFCVWRAAV
jgi:hypothetical protein